jgi:hypothetical protein
VGGRRNGEDSMVRRDAYRALLGKPEGKRKEATWKVQV